MTKSIDYVDIYRRHTKNRLLVRIDTLVFPPNLFVFVIYSIAVKNMGEG